MQEQFHLLSTVHPPRIEGETLQERFERFHEANPHVYIALVRLARQARSRGRRKIGMKMLFEVLRWNYRLQTDGEEFKLCNSYTSRYSRLIEAQEPDLAGLFEKRELLAA